MDKIPESSVVQERSADSALDDTHNTGDPRGVGGRATYDRPDQNAAISGASESQISKVSVGSIEPQSFSPPLGTNRFNLPKYQPQSGSEAQTIAPHPGGLFANLRSAVKHKVQSTLSDRGALGSMLLLCSIVGSSVFGGFLLGRSTPATNAGFTIVPASFSAFTVPTEGKAAAMGAADAQSVYVQQELTRQLGEMRAELLRLHSVFVQLAELAELDDGEFDLQSPLLDWKEQSSLRQTGLLNRRIAHMSAYSGTMIRIFNTRRMAFDQKISGRPLVEGHRSSGFGYRTDPITGERSEHLGLDYSGPVGEPILALADGVVTFSGKNSGYGNLVELEHVDGLRTRYAHNQLNLVSTGKMVKKGEAIATLGSTGRSTGPHVHIEVRLDGSPIDPGFFIR